MRIPIARYGRTEVLWLGLVTVGAFGLGLAVLPGGWWYWPGMVLAVLWAMVSCFFRDPERPIPADVSVLLAPADGKVTDVREMEESEYLGGPAVRIGIFLSVFDVHINRVPCSGVVEYVQAHPGKCLNAMRSEAASAHNEAKCLGLRCSNHPAGKVMVKQITGAIARRIVCQARVGDEFTGGQRYGMIKFGSRTELYIPANEKAEVLVKPGDTARAGRTILVRYGS